jgi:hypothetical protein
VQMVKQESELKTPEEKEFAVRKIYNYVNYALRLGEISKHKDLMT